MGSFIEKKNNTCLFCQKKRCIYNLRTYRRNNLVWDRIERNLSELSLSKTIDSYKQISALLVVCANCR